jgi:hypothetical protein
MFRCSARWSRRRTNCLGSDRHNNVSDADDAEFGGEFTLGGTNEALYTGDIDFVSLSYTSDPTFWAIPLQREFELWDKLQLHASSHLPFLSGIRSCQ